MPTTTEMVEGCLERDAMLREAMRAGIVNHRALARRLIEVEGIEASEAAVISALRRSGLGNARGPGLHHQVLARSSVTVRANVLGISLPRSRTTFQWVSRLTASLESPASDSVYVTYGHRHVRVLLDIMDRTSVMEEINTNLDVQDVQTLTEVRVAGPPIGKLGIGVASLVTTSLEANDVQVVEASGGGSIYHIFVRPDQATKAYAGISALIERCARSCGQDGSGAVVIGQETRGRPTRPAIRTGPTVQSS